jgi:hypothetical protein
MPVSFPVYHGSYTKIEHVDLLIGRGHLDFGRGFYVTKFLQQAETWATNICRNRRKQEQAVISEFIYGDNGFTQHFCKKKFFAAYDEEWLDFVVMNRNEANSEPAHDYDVVEGPVADDKIQDNIHDYLDGKITKVSFLEMLTHHEETHQICLCTRAGLQSLKHIDTTPRYEITHITEALLEALMFDRNVDEMEAVDIFFTSDTLAMLADKETMLYKKSWQEI